MPSLNMLIEPARLGTDELRETVDLSQFEARETIPPNLEEAVEATRTRVTRPGALIHSTTDPPP